MTVSTQANKAQFNGAGSAGPFTFNFRFFNNSEIFIVKTSVTGVDSSLTETVDYALTGAGSYSGGSITLTSSLAIGEKLTVYRVLPLTQTTDLRNQGAFFAEVHEDVFDRLTMIVQQQDEAIDRALQLSVATPDGVDVTLPNPEANNIIGWDNTGSALKNFNANEFATVVSYGTAIADIFTGDGTTTDFTLSFDPANINNLDVSVGGVSQLPGTDYTWVSGTTLTFTTAPHNGSKILARYMRALPMGSSEASSSAYLPAGTGAVATTVQAELRKTFRTSDYSTFAQAVTAATGYTLIVDSDVAISADTTVSVAIQMEPTGLFTVATGQTLTINGPFSCGLFQCFDGDGSVVFGAGSVSEVYPEWWGAVGDGVADDGLALQQMAASAVGGKLRLGKVGATYKSTRSVVISGEFDLNGSTLNFVVDGSTQCLDIRSDSSVYNGIITNNGTGVVTSGQYQCPVIIGDYGIGTGYSNINIHDLAITSNLSNGNGIMVTGDSANITISNINFPSSATLGRPLLIHWGGANTPSAGTYHPHNISISNISGGDMTGNVATVYNIAPLFFSGCYNVSVNNIKFGDITYGCALAVYPGDYGSQYSGTSATSIMKNITIDNYIVKSSLSGIYATTKNISGTLAIISGNIRINNAILTGNSPTAASTQGVYITNMDGLIVTNSYISNYLINIEFSGTSSNCTIEKNNIVSSYTRGISFGASVGYSASNISIINNTFAGNNTQTSAGRADIYAEYLLNSHITGNSFSSTNMTYSVRLINTCNTVELSNNYISVLTGTGLSIGSGSDYTINAFGTNNRAASGITLHGGAPIFIIKENGIREIYGSTAAPTTGAWVVGDRSVRTPVVGQPKSWICTVAGTPGTWVSEGNL